MALWGTWHGHCSSFFFPINKEHVCVSGRYSTVTIQMQRARYRMYWNCWIQFILIIGSWRIDRKIQSFVSSPNYRQWHHSLPHERNHSCAKLGPCSSPTQHCRHWSKVNCCGQVMLAKRPGQIPLPGTNAPGQKKCSSDPFYLPSTASLWTKYAPPAFVPACLRYNRGRYPSNEFFDGLF